MSRKRCHQPAQVLFGLGGILSSRITWQSSSVPLTLAAAVSAAVAMNPARTGECRPRGSQIYVFSFARPAPVKSLVLLRSMTLTALCRLKGRGVLGIWLMNKVYLWFILFYFILFYFFLVILAFFFSIYIGFRGLFYFI